MPGNWHAARWLDAEDATVGQAVAWALEHDPDAALRLVVALAPWWYIRGRLAAGYALLRAAAGHAAPGSDLGCAAHYWLGQAAHRTGDFAAAIGYFTAVRDAVADREPSPVLVDALAGRSAALVNINRIPEGIQDARRAVALAREMGYPAGEALALANLSLGAYYAGDLEDALACARQAQQIDLAVIPGWIARRCNDFLILVLLETGDLSSAGQCARTGWPRPGGRRHAQSGTLPGPDGGYGPAGRPHPRGRGAPAGITGAHHPDGRPAPLAQLPGHLRAPVRRNAALGRGRHRVGSLRRSGGNPRLHRSAAGCTTPRCAAAGGQASAGARRDPRSRAARRGDDGSHRRGVGHHAHRGRAAGGASSRAAQPPANGNW